jgi:hypothetical protein
MERVSNEFVFQRGHVFTTSRVCFVTNHERSTAQHVANAQLYILRDGKDWGFTSLQWAAVAVSSTLQPCPTILVLGRDGEVLIGDARGYREERIGNAGASPPSRGPMRNMRTVAGSAFAVGMGRQVYRRVAEGTWAQHESGLPRETSIAEVAGFNSIDGAAIDDLYAVGWGGEIWHHDGTLWRQEDSTTDLPLFDVVAASPSHVYACGQAGTILRGHAGRWTSVEFAGPKVSFRSMAWFQKKLFLADGHALYVLDNGKLSVVDLDVGATVPSSCVHANDGILLSDAGKEVFTTSNGVTWTPLPI